VELAAPDFAFPPAEWFGLLVVSSEERLNGLAQLIFRPEASTVQWLSIPLAQRNGIEAEID